MSKNPDPFQLSDRERRNLLLTGAMPLRFDILESRPIRQSVVATWCAAAFGADHASSVPQRAVRLLEEVLEAYQAAGADKMMAHSLVDYVFSRPVGEMDQELGGIGVTLLALAAAAGHDAEAAETKEVMRVLAKPLKEFAARNKQKDEAGFKVAQPCEHYKQGLHPDMNSSCTWPDQVHCEFDRCPGKLGKVS